MTKIRQISAFSTVIAACVILSLSCGKGPVGGYKVDVYFNNQSIVFNNARIYVEKVKLFERGDGTIGYESVPSNGTDFTHMLFTLVTGQEGHEPTLNMSWIAAVKDVPEIAGRNFAAFSIKMFPPLPEYSAVATTSQYIASLNGETCYILITVTNVEPNKKWINGIFNGVFVERVGNEWKRMEVRDGRFGANYSWAAPLKPAGEK